MKLKIIVMAVFLILLVGAAYYLATSGPKDMGMAIVDRTGIPQGVELVDSTFRRFVARPGNSEWITTRAWFLYMDGPYLIVPENRDIEAEFLDMVHKAESLKVPITLRGHNVEVKPANGKLPVNFYTIRMISQGDTLDLFTYIPDEY